jgi:hypothetical protein
VKGFKSVGNDYVNLKLLLGAEQLVSVAEQPVFCMASYLVFWNWGRFVYSPPDLILLWCSNRRLSSGDHIKAAAT